MAQQTALPESVVVDDSAQCMHHWVIQPATGPLSPGTCVICGEGRDFKNYVEGAAWGDSKLSGRSRTEAAGALANAVAGQSESYGWEDE